MSILVETGGSRLLVDCGPDLREQLLAASIDRINGLIITHLHADHCHGIDDLRPVAQGIGHPIPLHARGAVIDGLRDRFDYIFEGSSLYPAVVEAREIGDSLSFGETVLRFVDQPHGNVTSLGMRFDEHHRSLVYAIDFNALSADMASLYEAADVMICDCLSREPHPTHAHLDAVLGWARDLRVGQLYLSHLNNSMDYATLVSELPDWAAPAHDGLEIVL